MKGTIFWKNSNSHNNLTIIAIIIIITPRIKQTILNALTLLLLHLHKTLVWTDCRAKKFMMPMKWRSGEFTHIISRTHFRKCCRRFHHAAQPHNRPHTHEPIPCRQFRPQRSHYHTWHRTERIILATIKNNKQK